MLCIECRIETETRRKRCHNCYMRWYYLNRSDYREAMKKRVIERRKRLPDLRKQEYQKAKQKPGYIEKERIRKYILKDKIRFGGNRQFVLERDNHLCTFCHKKTNTVHHKDGHGYTQNEFPINNSIDNLITCCQSCHMKIFHRDLIQKNLVNNPPWNKGLTVDDPRVAKNMVGIHNYWKKGFTKP